MGEFRIGRKSAQHSYPTSRGLASVPLARNFASAPKDDLPISEAPILIPWSAIDSLDAWDAATTYGVGDLVSHLGGTWISLQAGNLNNEPGFSPLFWEANTVVPITPTSSGVVVIQGVIHVENTAVEEGELLITILVNGLPVAVPSPVEIEFAGGSSLSIPILSEVTGLPIGTTATVSIELSGEPDGDITLIANATTLEVREMQAATG